MGVTVSRLPGGGIFRDRVKIFRESHRNADGTYEHNPDGTPKRIVRHIATVDARVIQIPSFEEGRWERGGQIVLEPGGSALLDLQEWPDDLRKPMQDDQIETEDGSRWRITLSMYTPVMASIRTVRVSG